MSFIKSTMPVPAVTRRAFANPNKGKSKYPFADLAEGESLITTDFIDAEKQHKRLVSAVASYRKRSGDARRFLVRTFKQEDGVDAVGVFCVPAAPAEGAAA